VIRVAYFGLPLGAYLLTRDGFAPEFAALSPVDAPGRRRLSRLLPDRIVDLNDIDDSGVFEAEIDRRLASARADLIVSWYYTRRLPVRWLSAARLGAIGAHPSLLPRHRGPNPFFAAIDAGDAVTGVTVHRLVERYDEGDILLTEPLEIGERNAWQLARALDRPSLRLLRQAVGLAAQGSLPSGTPQDDALATWASEPTGERLRVDFANSTTAQALRRIRALAPVPGLALEIRGLDLFVAHATGIDDYPRTLEPGEAGVTRTGVVVRTLDGAVLLERAAAMDESGDVEDMDRLRLAERLGELPADAPDL